MEKTPNIKKSNKSFRYSEMFKKMIVSEIENGNLNKEQAKNKYDIGGKSTVLNWCRKYGDAKENYMKINKPSIEEKNRLYDLEKENQNLKEKVIVLETLIEVANKRFKIDIKKNVGFQQ